MSAKERKRAMRESQLKSAHRRGLPEVIFPWEVLLSAVHGVELEDDWEMLKMGFRISPRAVRSLILSVCNGYYDNKGYHLHPSVQFRISTAVFGLFNDFITKREFAGLAEGKGFRNHLVEEEKDMLVSPVHPALGSKVFSTAEEVALDIEKSGVRDRDFKVVLFHGKWNTIPHMGHVSLFRDVVQCLYFEYDLDPAKTVFVVLCDTNEDIVAFGNTPFLTTLWRVSLMSYLPYVNYACPSGEFGHRASGQKNHWWHKYKILKPDFVAVNPDHPRKEEVVSRCKLAGAVPLEITRASSYLPTLGNPMGIKVDKEVSSTNLRQGEADRLGMEREVLDLLTVKQIRDELYSPRSWFGPSDLIIPDPARGLTVEGLRSQVLLPKEKPLPWKIPVAPKAELPFETELRTAIAMLGV